MNRRHLAAAPATMPDPTAANVGPVEVDPVDAALRGDRWSGLTLERLAMHIARRQWHDRLCDDYCMSGEMRFVWRQRNGRWSFGSYDDHYRAPAAARRADWYVAIEFKCNLSPAEVAAIVLSTVTRQHGAGAAL